MFYGVSHIDIPVVDLGRSCTLYRDTLRLEMVGEGEGWVDLDSGNVRLRLLEAAAPEHPATIRVQTANVEDAVGVLVRAGAKLLHPVSRAADLTLMAAVCDYDGNTIIVWRALTEDEYGFDPTLPTTLTWSDDAEQLLKALLKGVPALFRSLARRKVVKEAEERAQNFVVNRDVVIRSFISSNAPLTRYRARKPLQANGIDPEDYKEEFAQP